MLSLSTSQTAPANGSKPRPATAISAPSCPPRVPAGTHQMRRARPPTSLPPRASTVQVPVGPSRLDFASSDICLELESAPTQGQELVRRFRTSAAMHGLVAGRLKHFDGPLQVSPLDYRAHATLTWKTMLRRDLRRSVHGRPATPLGIIDRAEPEEEMQHGKAALDARYRGVRTCGRPLLFFDFDDVICTQKPYGGYDVFAPAEDRPADLYERRWHPPHIPHIDFANSSEFPPAAVGWVKRR